MKSSTKPRKVRGAAPKQNRIPRERNDRRARHLLAALALSTITLLAFSNSFSAGFVLDNKGLLLEDPRIREATWNNVGLILQHTYWWPQGESGLYRPLTTLSYLFNYAVLGEGAQPAGYHWINFLLHVGNVLLVYALALRLIRKFWPSFFVAALWAVHPALTESVTNIIGRADLLAGMTLLSGFLMYLKSTEAAGWRRIAWLAGMMGVTTVGVFSKESAVAILGVIVLYELTWWKQRRQGRGLLLGCLAILPPLAVMLYQRSVVLGRSLPAEFPFTDNPIAGANFWRGRLTAIKVIARYLWLTFWPANLSNDYSYSQIPLARGGVQDWIAWIVVCAAVAVVALLYRWNRTSFFFACFAFVTLVPMSNLLFPIGTIMADRFLYLPSMGLLACLVLAIYSIAQKPGLAHFAPVVLCLITAGFAVRTWARNLDWKDDLAMATAGVRTSPHSFKTHRSLAAILHESEPAHSNIDRVIKEADRSLVILDPLPDSLNTPDVYRLAGSYYLEKGDLSSHSSASGAGRQAYQRALHILLRCIAIDKNARAIYQQKLKTQSSVAQGDPEAYRLLSAVYFRLGDAGRAFDAAAEAHALDPLIPDVYRQIAGVYLVKGRGDDAAVELMEGLLITSDMGLRQELLDLYRSGLDSKGCAVIAGPRGPALNPGCEIVRKHICAASVDTIKVRLQTGRRDLAEKQKKSFLNDYGCPAGPLDQALPD